MRGHGTRRVRTGAAPLPTVGRTSPCSDSAPATALDDGTLIAPFSNAPKPASPLTPGPLSVAYFAWKPGRSAWQQVTPNLTYQGQVYSATLQWSRGSQDASVTVVTMTGHVFDPQFAVSRCGLALGTNGG